MGYEAFDAPDSFRGRALDLAGDELSMAELAETLRDITGVPVEYVKSTGTISLSRWARSTRR